MQEYSSEAIVLSREPSGDLDLRASFFTKRYGKLYAKAKSARKITSKLSGHLNVGNLVQARFVEKGGRQVVDALKVSRIPIPPPQWHFLDLLLAEGEPDQGLWQMLVSGVFDWREVLKNLGWDPREAICALCRTQRPVSFHVFSQDFFCDACSLKSGEKELVYINNVGI